MTLHVDDGMLFGNKSSKVYLKARYALDKKFNIKKWSTLNGEKEEDYLGMQWLQYTDEDPRIVLHMDQYAGKLDLVDLPKRSDLDDNAVLTDQQYKDFLSGLGQVRWIVNHLIPPLAYAVSSVSQHGRQDLKISHLKELNGIIKTAISEQRKGHARFTFRPIDLSKLTVMTSFDASFAEEVGMKSQAGFFSYMTTSNILKGETICDIVEFHSGTIPRVVKSTMAAESAALSIALDRQLYLRLLIEAILYGEPEVFAHDWRQKLKIPGICVTDAKSLYDHLSKTGSVPKEKQTLIDLLTARDLAETKAVNLRWMPNRHMLADVLTKKVKPTPVLEKFLYDGLYSGVPTKEEVLSEEYRQELRRAQRQRRKDRKKEAKALSEATAKLETVKLTS